MIVKVCPITGALTTLPFDGPGIPILTGQYRNAATWPGPEDENGELMAAKEFLDEMDEFDPDWRNRG